MGKGKYKSKHYFDEDYDEMMDYTKKRKKHYRREDFDETAYTNYNANKRKLSEDDE